MSEEITNNENPEAENKETYSSSEVPFESRLDLTELQNMISNIRTEIKKIIVGQDNMIDLMICALLADGHILVEGVPGVAKTLTARLFAKTLDTGFSRIQFTDFEFKKGPIFSNLVLIDEINRSPAKTQSALFEVMQEKQITVDGNTYKMEAPFLVVATQNPIEHEGTYRLPEAQMDRFLFKIDVGYPSIEEEVQILEGSYNRKLASEIEQLNAVVNAAELNAQRKVISEIHVEKELMEYIAKIVHQTRNSGSIYIGASPRASVFILKASQAWAAMRGRDFITPEDVKQVIVPTLRHRITLTPEKEMEGIIPDQIIKQLADKVEVPR
jgi:MoxR-like ATPase